MHDVPMLRVMYWTYCGGGLRNPSQPMFFTANVVVKIHRSLLLHCPFKLSLHFLPHCTPPLYLLLYISCLLVQVHIYMHMYICMCVHSGTFTSVPSRHVSFLDTTQHPSQSTSTAPTTQDGGLSITSLEESSLSLNLSSSGCAGSEPLLSRS